MSFPESVYTQFFTLNPIFIVSGSSLAFPEQKNSEKKNMISVPITWGEFEGACPLKLTQGGVRGGQLPPPPEERRIDHWTTCLFLVAIFRGLLAIIGRA